MNKKEMTLIKECRSGNIKKVKSLIKGGLFSKKPNINCKDELGFTPLMGAAQFGKKEVLQLLITNGADINLENRSGFSAVQIAEMMCNDEIVSLLLDNKATGLKEVVNDEFRKVSLSSRIELMKIVGILRQDQPKFVFPALAEMGYKFQSDIKGFFKNQKLLEKGQFLLGEYGLLGILQDEHKNIVECEYIERGKMGFIPLILVQEIDETGRAIYKDITRKVV